MCKCLLLTYGQTLITMSSKNLHPSTNNITYQLEKKFALQWRAAYKPIKSFLRYRLQSLSNVPSSHSFEGSIYFSENGGEARWVVLVGAGLKGNSRLRVVVILWGGSEWWQAIGCFCSFCQKLVKLCRGGEKHSEAGWLLKCNNELKRWAMKMQPKMGFHEYVQVSNKLRGFRTVCK